MVIIKVPYSLSYQDEARIYKKLVTGAPAFRDVHLDPHVLDLASVFAILTRLRSRSAKGWILRRSCGMYSGESVEGVPESEAARLKAGAPMRA